MSISAVTSPAEKGTADPVRAVSVVSTGTVEIHPEHAYGGRKPLYWWLLISRTWLPPRPINAYVIEHAVDPECERSRDPDVEPRPSRNPAQPYRARVAHLDAARCR